MQNKTLLALSSLYCKSTSDNVKLSDADLHFYSKKLSNKMLQLIKFAQLIDQQRVVGTNVFTNPVEILLLNRNDKLNLGFSVSIKDVTLYLNENRERINSTVNPRNRIDALENVITQIYRLNDGRMNVSCSLDFANPENMLIELLLIADSDFIVETYNNNETIGLILERVFCIPRGDLILYQQAPTTFPPAQQVIDFEETMG